MELEELKLKGLGANMSYFVSFKKADLESPLELRNIMVSFKRTLGDNLALVILRDVGLELKPNGVQVDAFNSTHGFWVVPLWPDLCYVSYGNPSLPEQDKSLLLSNVFDIINT